MPKCRDCGDELTEKDRGTVCRSCIWAEVAFDHEDEPQHDEVG